ncbi:MAG TPA: GNAT family N-acetyltransferase [Pseudonocardiaceae bacterium]|jgi:GNAT superfamily N-acetyltransferase|nr:GNAT family N-acetyltransferase [Pseudonocardiaceae bacterium]
MDAPETAAPATWRLRAELNDRPGALAKLTSSLAARDCNILALTVLPVPDGVIDDLIISTPADLRPADLVTLVRATGGRCAGITKADVRDLADPPTEAVRIAIRLAGGATDYPEAVRDLVDADTATPTDLAEDGSGPGDRQVVEAGLLLRRGWAAFTEVELARSAALAELVEVLGVPGVGPMAVVTSDGAGVVLRDGAPTDTDALAAMHDRCSRATLFARYHSGRRVPHKLLAPPRGRTVVGVVGHQVIALGQLTSTTDPAVAEVSLLVEDDWQNKGVGSSLLRHLARTARAAGHTELIGWCRPGEDGLIRAAARVDLPTSTTRENDLQRVSLKLHEPAFPTPALG